MTVQVKICGITNVDDAREALLAGADLLGFVFFPRSSRYVTPAQARAIIAAARQVRSDWLAVGVFVDEPLETVHSMVAECGLDRAQLHGVESPAMVAALEAAGVRVIKAFRVREAESLAEVGNYPATALLLDAYVPGSAGGAGVTFDWELAQPARGTAPVLLAGGLTPENVAEAVAQVQPWGVDVSSGVESAPGRKDAAKLRAFVAAAKGIQI